MSRTLLLIIGVLLLLAGIFAYIAPDFMPSIRTALGSYNAIVKLAVGLIIVLIALSDKK